MAISLVLFPLLALALGFKHAYDADHLVAVSNFLTRSKGISETSRMTVSWAMGHMVTAAIITAALFMAAASVASVKGILNNLDLGVAVMLIAIGAAGIFFGAPITHEHPHNHADKPHSHLHSHRFGALGLFGRKMHVHHPLFGVGILHGLASNDELIAIFVAGLGIGSLELLLGGVAIFTIGVALGMTLFGVAITYPIFRYGIRKVQLAINIVAGSLSIMYGLMIIAGLGGFNPFTLILG